MKDLTGRVGFWLALDDADSYDRYLGRPGHGGLTNLSTGPFIAHGSGKFKQTGIYLDQVAQQVRW